MDFQKGSERIRNPLKIFSFCAPEDKYHLDKLQKRLKSFKNIVQSDNLRISAGSVIAQTISDEVESATIILLLVSPDLVSNTDLDIGITQALKRAEANTTRIIPVLLRPTMRENALFRHLQCLPRNQRPIVRWRCRDQALLEIQEEIGAIINELSIKHDKPMPEHGIQSTKSVTRSVLTPPNSQERSKADENSLAILSTPPHLLGLAVDLSGSMAEKIRNNTGGQITRLESLSQSLGQIAKDLLETVDEEDEKGDVQGNNEEYLGDIEIFAYGFGLRSTTMEVCDLLSLLTEVRKMRRQIEQITQRYTDENKNKLDGLESLNDLATRYGLRKLAQRVRRVGKARAEKVIRDNVMREVKALLEPKLITMEDTTMPIDELATLLSVEGNILGNAEEIIYGDTPMCEALRKTIQRFKDELSERPASTNRALCIISDGDPTDCKNIQPMKEDLELLGVTIISCFVTDKDLSHPRTLVGVVDSEWDEGAQLLFSMASPFKIGTDIDNYLKKRNMELEEKASQSEDDEEKQRIKEKQWTIAPEAKLFVQINHSEHLKEFIDFTLRVFGEQEALEATTRGH